MDSLLNTAAEFIARHSVWAGAVLVTRMLAG